MDVQPGRGQSLAEAAAEAAADGIVPNVMVGYTFTSCQIPGLDVTTYSKRLHQMAEDAAAGDHGAQEKLLTAQAVSLNAIYMECAILARRQIPSNLEVFERLMRIGLKAQSQSRAIAETLALMRNPSTVIAGQANIAHGPQQINNAVVRSRARKCTSVPNELLESHGQRVDAGTKKTTIRRRAKVASMGTLDRTENG